MYCSRCGKKVLDSMLYCPFCGAEIIIPEQDSREDEAKATPEPVKVDPVFSFDIPADPEDLPEPEPQSAEPEPSFAQMRFPWEEPEAEEEPVIEPEPEPEPPKIEEPAEAFHAAIPEMPKPERKQANVGNVVPGHRSNETLVPDKTPVPDKASMFMDEAEDFDVMAEFNDESDEFDDFEEALEREKRRGKKAAQSRRRRYEEDDPDDEDDDDDEDRSFVSRHIRGIVGILLFLILLAVLAFYALSDAGQMSLAKINATLPLRAEIYSKIAYEYYQSGDYAQAGLYYERALARDADSYNYASSAAMAYISGGNNDKAAEMLKKCVQLNPDAVEPYVYLLNLYPNADSRPWDVAQLLKRGYEKTGDARLEAANDAPQG